MTVDKQFTWNWNGCLRSAFINRETIHLWTKKEHENNLQ